MPERAGPGELAGLAHGVPERAVYGGRPGRRELAGLAHGASERAGPAERPRLARGVPERTGPGERPRLALGARLRVGVCVDARAPSCLLLCVLLGAGLAACDGGQPTAPPDGADAGAVDAGPPADAATDAVSSDASAVDAGFTCEPGAGGCHGRTHYTCGADGESRQDEEVCPAGCDPELGCVSCEPDDRVCDGTVSLVCNETGDGWIHGRDCADWGSACVSGWCDDPCAAAEATKSYMGCEYFAVPLAQTRELDERTFDFRVVVANPSPRPVEVTVRRGSRIESRRRIVPGGLVDISLPWIDTLSFPAGEQWDASVVVSDGAYRITSTYPVLVSQLSPYHYASFEPALSYSYTNDASLLLPAHTLGDEHLAASYVPLSTARHSAPGYVAIVGTAPEGTTVEVLASAPIAADPEGRWGAVSAGESFSFELERGQVAQLIGAPPPACTEERPGYADGVCRESEHDLTGSRVLTDRPVAVFSGHVCAFVPYDTAACDHLETQVSAVSTWGQSFQTMPMREPGTPASNLLRVIAARDETTVTFDPPIRDGASVTLGAGEHVELMLDDALSITADQPIQVAQLLLGQEHTEPKLERGDPSLTVLVPAEQFRYDYVFATPSSYADSPDGRAYVLVSRAPGASIELDGAALEATWTPIGDRELAIVRVTGGAHHAVGSSPFGLIAFGLGSYTSYAHPAGLDLRVLH